MCLACSGHGDTWGPAPPAPGSAGMSPLPQPPAVPATWRGQSVTVLQREIWELGGVQTQIRGEGAPLGCLHWEGPQPTQLWLQGTSHADVWPSSFWRVKSGSFSPRAGRPCGSDPRGQGSYPPGAPDPVHHLHGPSQLGALEGQGQASWDPPISGEDSEDELTSGGLGSRGLS